MFDIHRRDDNFALSSIPVKANKILHFLLCLLILMVLRLWHLTVIQHEKKVEEAFKTRKKVCIEPAERGTIRDRFNVVLAANTIRYRLSIIYAQFQEIPAIVFEKDEMGNKKKRYVRKEYIRTLSEVLAKELTLPQDRVEDLIYSHASLNYQIPFCIKDDLTEQQYYRLKMLSKDFPGIHVERVPKRYYPRGRLAADVIGYLAPIQKEEYTERIEEMRALNEFIKSIEQSDDYDGVSLEEAKHRLLELEEHAYTINDDVGRLGIEASFEEMLRGYYGKRVYFSDAKGNFMREVPGSHPPLPGSRVLLSLSAELQELAEKLLIQSDQDREKAALLDPSKKEFKAPWVRGGAIVVMEPNTGEVLALASHPRFDPNDFIRKRARFFGEEPQNDVLRWIESEDYIAKVWDQKIPLKREVFVAQEDSCRDEEKKLTWEAFLELVLPPDSPIKSLLSKDASIGSIISLQRSFAKVCKSVPQLLPQEVMNALYPSPDHEEVSYGATANLKQFLKTGIPLQKTKELDNWFSGIAHNQEKLLLLDLTRLIVDEKSFDEALLPYVKNLSIDDFRAFSSLLSTSKELAKAHAKKVFRKNDFAEFRREHEKEFLQQKRLEEKQKKLRTIPYLEYLDKEEQKVFAAFWQKWQFVLIQYVLGQNVPVQYQKELEPYLDSLLELRQKNQEIGDILSFQKTKLPASLYLAFLKSLKSFEDLNEPLVGTYRGLKKLRHAFVLKDLASSFAPIASPGSGRSFSFRSPSLQGSIFKLVTAYAALKQRFEDLKGKVTPADFRLFEIVDHTFKANGKHFVGNFSNGQNIPQIYKGGRLLKSVSPNIGKVDLLRAIEMSSNPYFSLLAGDFLRNPESLVYAAKDFGLGSCTEAMLPGEFSGKLPSDLSSNKTGLYATAVGQHTLLVTPLQTACLLSALANGGKVLRPKIVSLAIGAKLPFEKKNSHLFPLFSQKSFSQSKNEVQEFLTSTKNTLFLPEAIRTTLMQGMRGVVSRIQEDHSPAFLRIKKSYPQMFSALQALQGEWVGKTGTAESQEKIGLDTGLSSHMYNHIWFGGISFDTKSPQKPSNSYVFCDEFGKPELVVVVHLRYGNYGKEAAPIAATLIQKWREICQQRQNQTTFVLQK